MYVQNQSHDICNISANNVNLNIVNDSDYSYCLFQEKIAFVVFSLIFGLTTIAVSILLGTGVVSTVISGVLYAAILTLLSLTCIISIFICNVMKYKGNNFLLFQKSIKLRKGDVSFLTKLSQGMSFLRKNMGKKTRFSVIPKTKRIFSTNKEDIQTRIDLASKRIIQLVDSFTDISLSSNDTMLNLLLGEFKNIFITQWGRKKNANSILTLLGECGLLFQQYSASDAILMLLHYPDKSQFIMSKILSWMSNYGSCEQLLQGMQFINKWWFGWFLQANNAEILKSFDNISIEMRQALDQGNVIQFLFYLMTEAQQLQFKSLLGDFNFGDIAAKNSNQSVNSKDYLYEMFRNKLNKIQELSSFLETFPSPDSKWFIVSLGMHYNKFQQLGDYLLTHKSLFMENSFAILEILHKCEGLQKLLRGIMSAIMPASQWKCLIQPYFTGVFASDSVSLDEIQVFVRQIGISNAELIRVLEQNNLLASLVPELFSDEVD